MLIIDLAILSSTDVDDSLRKGFRFVEFNKIIDDGALEGRILESILDIKHDAEIQLDGGKMSSARICADELCKRKSVQFTLRPDVKLHFTLHSLKTNRRRYRRHLPVKPLPAYLMKS